MIETVQKLMSTDCQMTLQIIEEELKIGRETTGKILVEHLRKLKICARFVPCCLTAEQKALTIKAFQEFIQFVDDDYSLFDSTLMGDENGVFSMIPKQKT
jgi:hypothetical protein